jgi:hypothetical protein
LEKRKPKAFARARDRSGIKNLTVFYFRSLCVAQTPVLGLKRFFIGADSPVRLRKQPDAPISDLNTLI